MEDAEEAEEVEEEDIIETTLVTSGISEHSSAAAGIIYRVLTVVYVRVCKCVCVCVYVYVYARVYVYASRHTGMHAQSYACMCGGTVM